MREYDMTDREQIDMLKKWWKDYGQSIAIAIMVGLVLSFGWRYWRAHQQQQVEQASSLYQTMMILDLEDFRTTINGRLSEFAVCGIFCFVVSQGSGYEKQLSVCAGELPLGIKKTRRQLI